MVHILLAEDDQFLSDGISRALRYSGYKIDQAFNGEEAEQAAVAGIYDLIILDLGLPKLNGLEVLQRIRTQGKTMPVLVLTALDSTEDRIKGLDLGANDYMGKPFDVGELEARIRALLRKNQWDNQVQISNGSLVFNTVARRVSVNDEFVELSPREMAVLELLLQRCGRVVSKADLVEHLSGLDKDCSSNAVDIIIFRLRKKLLDSGCEIKTVWGLGYLIEKK